MTHANVKPACTLRAIALFVLAILVFCPAAQGAISNQPLAQGLLYEDSECLMCHSAPVTSEKTGRSLKAVNVESIRHSVHKDRHCIQCHKGARLNQERSHMTAITTVECGDCHFKGNTIGAPQHDIAKDYSTGVHGQSLLKDKNSQAPHCWDCHTGHSVRKWNDKKSSVDRDRIVSVCTRCHYDSKKMRKYNLNATLIVQYKKTPHALARKREKNSKAAICTDCHGNHNIKHRDSSGNPLNHRNLPKTCGACHEDIFKTFKMSIHGQDWLEGKIEVPVCSTCHGEHEIRYVKSKESRVYPSHVVSLCSDCHANVALRSEYNLQNTVASYKESYHGIVNKMGDTEAANCASCHGHHDILPPDDPRSTVNPAHLAKTCGQCHKQAELNKSLGRIHTAADPGNSRVLYLIKLIYLLMITGSIGGMLFYVFTDLFGFIVRQRRRLRGTAHEEHADPALPDDLLVERWPPLYRVQHLLLIVSFTMLVLTGMPLVLPDFILFRAMAHIPWLYNLRGITHRIFGFGMLALCVYHVLFVIANAKARRDMLNMIPKPKDAKDALDAVLFNLTIRDEHPHMPRYNFIEKFEYLAMVWGSFVMVATGLVLTFNTLLLQFLPKLAFDAATLVHKFEAILATLAIIIWHMYTVHLCPDFFPMNKVFLNGKISLRNLRKHHAQEYEEVAETLKRDMPAPEKAPDEPGDRNGGGVQ